MGEILVEGSNAVRGGSSYLAKIDGDDLARNLRDMLANLGSGFAKHPMVFSAGSVSELEIALSVSVEGKVSILGSGASAGAVASLKLRISLDQKV